MPRKNPRPAAKKRRLKPRRAAKSMSVLADTTEFAELTAHTSELVASVALAFGVPHRLTGKRRDQTEEGGV